jgi:hypothetical protein
VHRVRRSAHKATVKKMEIGAAFMAAVRHAHAPVGCRSCVRVGVYGTKAPGGRASWSAWGGGVSSTTGAHSRRGFGLRRASSAALH